MPLLLVIEGIDGAGKSSLASVLHQELLSRGFCVVVTKEPGDNNLGLSIRSIVQSCTYDLDPKAEFLLFAADRAQHIKEVVRPALERGCIVICDRMADSSRAYQGFGRGLDHALITSVNTWVLDGIKPDKTIYVRISIDEAAARTKHRSETTRFESERRAFMERVALGFQEMYKDRDDVIVLDGMDSKDAVADTMLQALIPWIEKRSMV